MTHDPVVIVEALRTPIGSYNGTLSRLSSPELGAVALRGVLSMSGIKRDLISEVLMGCVLTAGVGQAPARQATLKAGLGENVPATTIGKVCGSGMKAIMIAHDQICYDKDAILLAGGMESMSRAPKLTPVAGHSSGREVLDHLFYDGLEDAYTNGKMMGHFAEDTAAAYGFTREAQDAFALESLRRAQETTTKGIFVHEVVPISIKTPEGDVHLDQDEPVLRARPEKIPNLKPVFKEDGTITAANASGISDGAAALLMMRQSIAKKLGLPIKATILGHASYAQKPALFTTAPVGAIQKLLKTYSLGLDEIDLFEINEAFAVVTMACLQDLNIDHAKTNIYGGGCALGHPIGASGARIVVTLLNALRQTGGTYGVASLCIGGGEATALLIKRGDQ